MQVVRMEAEVVAMTAELMGGGGQISSQVCGTMTSGGMSRD
jgi:glutamate/tyrosine decarboxylase-like PLP-dependent enzyme